MIVIGHMQQTPPPSGFVELFVVPVTCRRKPQLFQGQKNDDVASDSYSSKTNVNNG